MTVHDPRRAIPSVDRLLASPDFADLLEERPRELVVATLQNVLTGVRGCLGNGGDRHAPDAAALARQVRAAIHELSSGSLRPVINATGVVLHTNLGRAPLAPAALAAIQATARGYSNLEYDTRSGSRGSRYDHCRSLLQQLTGAEDALVVNNNAAALVLAVNTLSRGREAVVSRGELVEIGGAFRIPEIMARSGARLREIGSTNRTHAADYDAAISPSTGVLLKVHPSNFTIEGFTAEVGAGELAGIAARAGVPLVHDIGSGLLLDPVSLGLPADEPTPRSSLAAGTDVVTMSGDKLLGGPQCGILLGRAALLERMRRNPLCRALRVDKLTLAALDATLRSYIEGTALQEIPVLRMLCMDPSALIARAHSLAAACADAGCAATVVDGTSAVGGGASPSAKLRTALVALDVSGLTAQELERRLRLGDTPVIARIVDDAVILDPRTVAPDEEPALVAALRVAVGA